MLSAPFPSSLSLSAIERSTFPSSGSAAGLNRSQSYRAANVVPHRVFDAHAHAVTDSIICSICTGFASGCRGSPGSPLPHCRIAIAAIAESNRRPTNEPHTHAPIATHMRVPLLYLCRSHLALSFFGMDLQPALPIALLCLCGSHPTGD